MTYVYFQTFQKEIWSLFIKRKKHNVIIESPSSQKDSLDGLVNKTLDFNHITADSQGWFLLTMTVIVHKPSYYFSHGDKGALTLLE